MADGAYRPPDGFLTMSDAASQLGTSIVTLRKLIRDRSLQTFSDPLNGRVRLLRQEDVDELRKPLPRQ